MIGCLRTRVRKQPIIALYFESENELKLYNLEAWFVYSSTRYTKKFNHMPLGYKLECVNSPFRLYEVLKLANMGATQQ